MSEEPVQDEAQAATESAKDRTVEGEPDATLQEAAAANQVESDGFVNAKWGVAILPRQNVSIHFQVTPTGDATAVTSVTASFVETRDGMIVNTFAGSTVSGLLEPREGQGLTGDMGADFAVFGNRGFGQVSAVLAGLVTTSEGPRNFFFKRDIDPAS